MVEDNERLSDHVVAGLRAAGLETDPVVTAADALSAFAAQSYDAVILDLGLPDRDGLALLREMREFNRHIPILILTARDSL